MSAHPYNTQAFAFLASPPPPQTHKKRFGSVVPSPATPLPPTPPHKFQAIRAWAATVTPGSPAPRSPHRRLSISSTTSRRSRRPSLTVSRRPSLVLNLNLNQGQLENIDPSPATAGATATGANKFDLTALGYTSVFVHLPNTPTTPSPLLREYDLKHRQPVVPDTAKRSGPMRRFRSLSILRPSRAKQSKKTDVQLPQTPSSPLKNSTNTQAYAQAQAQAQQPTTPHTAGPISPSTAYSKAEICAAKIAKRKRAKYAYVRPPPTLAHEIALMQFADGGSVETHIKRVMETQAKLAAGSRAGRTGGATTIGGGNGTGNGVAGGVADVYRDANGGIWWDADEEMEYAHLLEGDTTQEDGATAPGEMDWEESFVSEPLGAFLASAPGPGPAAYAAPATDINMLGTGPLINAPRRASTSSIASSLSPAYLLPLPENENPALQPIDDRVLASRRIGGEEMSFLGLPTRARREAVYLKKGCEAGWGLGGGKENPAGSGRGRGDENENENEAPVARPRGKARRRPAPLKLASAASSTPNATARRSRSRSRSRSQSRARVGLESPHPPPPSAALPLPPPLPSVVPAVTVTITSTTPAKEEFFAASFDPVRSRALPSTTVGGASGAGGGDEEMGVDGYEVVDVDSVLGVQMGARLQRTTTMGKRVRGLFSSVAVRTRKA